MKKWNAKVRFGLAIGGSLVGGLLLGALLFGGNDTAVVVAPGAGEDMAAAAAAEPTTWTCSMHPQILQPEPGDCPICGMDLIPLVEDAGGDQGPRTMSMSEASRALAEIQTTEVQRMYPEAKVRIVGTLGYDETLERSLSARFPARIDRLYINYTGIAVERGEHLAEVYSPELLSAQRELISAYRNNPDSSITRAAREKLRLWGLLPEQIDQIVERGEPSDSFELRAPIGGVVVSKNVKEGDYVDLGESLFKIVDLDQLWLNLEAYESDLPWLRYGQDVNFTVAAYPGETFSGQIAFIEPEVNRKTRTVPVRVNVPNEGGRLKPGMLARGVVDVRVAEEGAVYAPELAGKWISPMHPEIVKDGPGQCDICGMDLVPAEELGYVGEAELEPPVVVPASAVLRTGKRAVVYVKVPDAERPTFEGREVVLGPRAGDWFVVSSGLEPGEEVVTKGAFKIDSALQIQAKPSMMSADAAGEGSEEESAPALRVDTELAQKILPSYLILQERLAADDAEGAQAALRAMMDVTGHDGPVPALVHEMLGAEDLENMRYPHFEDLSDALIAAVQEAPDAFEGELYRMHCPMARDGASWIQDEPVLENPYFGAMMFSCGDVQGVLNATTDSETQEDHDGHAH